MYVRKNAKKRIKHLIYTKIIDNYHYQTGKNKI